MRRSMFRSRAFRLAVIAFVAVWFGAIVPGHTRGVVKLPGASACEASANVGRSGPPCCAGGAARGKGKSPVNTGPCAVCFFAAALIFAPPVTFYEPRPGVARRAVLAVPVIVMPPDRAGPFHSRAPPLA